MELACLDFLNSDHRDYRNGVRTDRLLDEQWRAGFVNRWGFADAGAAGKATIAALRELRETMWRVVDATVGGKRPVAADLDALDTALAATALRRRFVHTDGTTRVNLEPAKRDWTWVGSEIIASFSELLASHGAERIRRCDNPDCRWVFYDESKNRSRRWCDDTCGNLLKVRRFRSARRR